MANATMNDFSPLSMAALPSDGPTTVSWLIWAGAGIFPDLRILERSSASSRLKSPVISVLPPAISFCTLGYDLTYPSRTTAMQRPILSRVIRCHILAPSAFMEKSTLISVPVTPVEGRAEVTTSPERGARPSRVDTLMACSSYRVPVSSYL